MSLLVLVILIVPTIDAFIINNTTDEIEEIQATGSVYGQVRYYPDGYCRDMPWPRTLVRIGTKYDVSKKPTGDYNIIGLALERIYIITRLLHFF